MISAFFSRVTSIRLAAKDRARLLIVFFIAWAILILGIYYLQLWRLIAYGEWQSSGFHGDLSLPYFGEALSRAAAGVGGAGLLILASVLLGGSIFVLAGWRFSGFAEFLPFAAAFGTGIFAYLGFGLAGLGLYRTGWLAFMALALPVVGLVLFLVRWKSYSNSEANPIQRLPQSLRKKDLIWASLAALGLALAFVAALAPEREYDALWYHLAYPKLYLEQGRLVDLPWDYVSLYPMTWELWFGYGLVFGGQTAATLLHFACLPLTALVVFITTRRYVPSASPWLAVASFITIPTVMWEASTAYIDLALALHTALLIYALLRYLERQRVQWFLLAAANLGLALASKHLALIIFGLAVLGLFFALRAKTGVLKKALAHTFFLGLLALLPAFPWYLRSYRASGNPVFPELFWLFGAPPERWDAITQQGLNLFLDNFGRPLSLHNLLTLPWHMTIHAEAYHGSLGPLFLLLLPFLMFKRLRGALPWLALFAILYIVFWASPLSSLQMRFLVPLTPVLAVLASAAFARIRAAAMLGWGYRATNALTAFVALLLFLNLPPFTSLHEHDRVEWQGWLNSVLHGVEWPVVVGAESGDAYLTRQVRSYAAWNYANHNLPAEARVLTWAGGDQFYAERDWIWAYSTQARPVAWADVEDQYSYLPNLQSLGITHLIVEGETITRLETLPSGGPVGGYFELLHQDRWYSLYRVRWELFP